MALKRSPLLAILCFLFICVLNIQARSPIEEDEEVKVLERQLSSLNKPPIMSFKTDYGMTIDCIDIYKQPAFDNPLLKNHTIQYAVVKFKKLDKPYVSAQGTFSTHLPPVDAGEMSGARVWIYGGGGPDGNSISAGWTGDGGAGCANTQCPGFVQTNQNDLLGYFIRNISSHQELFAINVKNFQDGQTGNWWLATERNFVPIGYWPRELFPQLSGGASNIAYGGITKARPNYENPAMGSGLADCDFYHTAYIHNIGLKAGSDQVTPNWSQAEIDVDCPNEYTVQHNCEEQLDPPNFYFLYGGAAGVC
ncbi:uncharacterized protein LOC116187863 [Punica granatum]|uniref:Uncharacterized protein LOC116187863 n=1 Tax=Punica granatum TaxID=22663 RepID=A0A218XZE2_PUNGR|nr:uncharacterized protein LOC116187863 [Punica granatum]OWM90016.1 hypothetical protein CDL15_Pgr026929 [Punica granatum]